MWMTSQHPLNFAQLNPVPDKIDEKKEDANGILLLLTFH